MASSSIHPLLPPSLADPTPKRDFPLPLPRRRPTLSREAKRNQPPSPLPPPRRCYRGLGASLAYTHRHHRHPTTRTGEGKAGTGRGLDTRAPRPFAFLPRTRRSPGGSPALPLSSGPAGRCPSGRHGGQPAAGRRCPGLDTGKALREGCHPATGGTRAAPRPLKTGPEASRPGTDPPPGRLLRLRERPGPARSPQHPLSRPGPAHFAPTWRCSWKRIGRIWAMAAAGWGSSPRPDRSHTSAGSGRRGEAGPQWRNGPESGEEPRTIRKLPPPAEGYGRGRKRPALTCRDRP